MSDHFIPLVKVLKSKARIEWKDIIAWYSEHYYTLTSENEHNAHYINAIAEILTNYIDGLGLVRMKEIVKRLSPEKAWENKYYDFEFSPLDPRYYNYRVINVCCSILINTIPASVLGEAYHKE